ncbi:energy transducer TonB [Shewanella youngdeokensis]|uniref:TonB family protein n=1 Tax=Shewanella youngdeokensis TaxID=2999068 RepID=A0ABZ0JWE2_9GAMM|nr:TonB family protein [Shewanella sp. DAU334]
MIAHGKGYRVAVLLARLLLSVGLTILLCYYLPASLNQRPGLQVATHKPTDIAVQLPEPQKQKTAVTKEADVKPVSAKVSTPVLTRLPVMSAVADMPISVPVLAVPSLTATSLPEVGPVMAGINDVDQPPELLRYIQPKMPVAGRKFKDGGRVLLRLIVEADGIVSHAEVLDATPEKVFDESAMKAARKWRFKPAVLSGEAVKVFVDVPINFKVS